MHVAVRVAQKTQANTLIHIMASHYLRRCCPGALQYKPLVVRKKFTNQTIQAFTRGGTPRPGLRFTCIREKPRFAVLLIEPLIDLWEDSIHDWNTPCRAGVLQSRLTITGLSTVSDSEQPPVLRANNVSCRELIQLFYAGTGHQHQACQGLVAGAYRGRIKGCRQDEFDLRFCERDPGRLFVVGANAAILEDLGQPLTINIWAHDGFKVTQLVFDGDALVTVCAPEGYDRPEIININVLDGPSAHHCVKIGSEQGIFSVSLLVYMIPRLELPLLPLFCQDTHRSSPQINHWQRHIRRWLEAVHGLASLQCANTIIQKSQAFVVKFPCQGLERSIVTDDLASVLLLDGLEYGFKTHRIIAPHEPYCFIFVRFKFLNVIIPGFCNSRLKLLYVSHELGNAQRTPCGHESCRDVISQLKTGHGNAWCCQCTRSVFSGPSGFELRAILLSQFRGGCFRHSLVDIANVHTYQNPSIKVRAEILWDTYLKDVSLSFLIESQVLSHVISAYARDPPPAAMGPETQVYWSHWSLV